MSVDADSDAELVELRTVLRDLVALSAIPAVGRQRTGRRDLRLDVLIGLLQLDFAYVRLCVPDVADVVEVTRGDAWRLFRDGWQVISPKAVGCRLRKLFPTSAAEVIFVVSSFPLVSAPRVRGHRGLDRAVSPLRLTCFC